MEQSKRVMQLIFACESRRWKILPEKKNLIVMYVYRVHPRNCVRTALSALCTCIAHHLHYRWVHVGYFKINEERQEFISIVSNIDRSHALHEPILICFRQSCSIQSWRPAKSTSSWHLVFSGHSNLQSHSCRRVSVHSPDWLGSSVFVTLGYSGMKPSNTLVQIGSHRACRCCRVQQCPPPSSPAPRLLSPFALAFLSSVFSVSYPRFVSLYNRH